MEYFMYEDKEIDNKPIGLKYTWSNGRVGPNHIATKLKIIDGSLTNIRKEIYVLPSLSIKLLSLKDRLRMT